MSRYYELEFLYVLILLVENLSVCCFCIALVVSEAAEAEAKPLYVVDRKPTLARQLGLWLTFVMEHSSSVTATTARLRHWELITKPEKKIQ